MVRQGIISKDLDKKLEELQEGIVKLLSEEDKKYLKK